jgi:hypothetical protein
MDLELLRAQPVRRERRRGQPHHQLRRADRGGCAAGVPPANLGFRLVREPKSWVASVSQRLGKALSVARS